MLFIGDIEKELKCKICEKPFRNSRMLRWHIDYVHSKKVKCRACGFMAKSQAVMRCVISKSMGPTSQMALGTTEYHVMSD